MNSISSKPNADSPGQKPFLEAGAYQAAPAYKARHLSKRTVNNYRISEINIRNNQETSSFSSNMLKVALLVGVVGGILVIFRVVVRRVWNIAYDFGKLNAELECLKKCPKP